MRTLSLTLAALAAFTLATTAAPKPEPPAPAPAAAQAGKPVGFDVTADDLTATGFVHINKDGARITYTVTDKTEVTNAGQPAKFADIKAGDLVAGSRRAKTATEYEIVRITKFGPRPPKPAKPSPKK